MPRLTAEILLRIGVAFAFFYPAVSAIFTPFAWIGYFPQFILAFPLEDMLTLHAFGALEVLIGLWILFGKNIFWPSAAAAAMLVAIVALNFSQLDVVFRDISIALTATALALEARKKSATQSIWQPLLRLLDQRQTG